MPDIFWNHGTYVRPFIEHPRTETDQLSLLRVAREDTYLFLSHRADIMKRLRVELDQAMPNRHSISDISVLKKLPYFGAFSKEGEWHFYLN